MSIFKSKGRHQLRRRMAGVAVAGAAALALAGTAGAGVAGANTNNPFGGSVLVPQEGAPHFNTPQASTIIRTSGSDTTIFVMQKISDIYTTAGLYGCTLGLANGNPIFWGGRAPPTVPFRRPCHRATTTSTASQVARLEPRSRAVPVLTFPPPTPATTGTGSKWTPA